MWWYFCYVCVDVSICGPAGRQMMNEVRKYCDLLRVGGSFPPEQKI